MRGSPRPPATRRRPTGCSRAHASGRSVAPDRCSAPEPAGEPAQADHRPRHPTARPVGRRAVGRPERPAQGEDREDVAVGRGAPRRAGRLVAHLPRGRPAQPQRRRPGPLRDAAGPGREPEHHPVNERPGRGVRILEDQRQLACAARDPRPPQRRCGALARAGEPIRDRAALRERRAREPHAGGRRRSRRRGRARARSAASGGGERPAAERRDAGGPRPSHSRSLCGCHGAIPGWCTWDTGSGSGPTACSRSSLSRVPTVARAGARTCTPTAWTSRWWPRARSGRSWPTSRRRWWRPPASPGAAALRGATRRACSSRLLLALLVGGLTLALPVAGDLAGPVLVVGLGSGDGGVLLLALPVAAGLAHPLSQLAGPVLHLAGAPVHLVGRGLGLLLAALARLHGRCHTRAAGG